MIARCDKCIYWIGDDELYGECHRYPPTLTEDGCSLPYTSSTEWCGEYMEIMHD